MIDIILGDIWDYHAKGFFIVIPTNGSVKGNGELVMGRGLAFQAKEKFIFLPIFIGNIIRKEGNIVQCLENFNLFTFPVKHQWNDKADIYLIEQSFISILAIIKEKSTRAINPISLPVYFPLVGCGNGGLNWRRQVKSIASKYYDEKFMRFVHNDESTIL